MPVTIKKKGKEQQTSANELSVLSCLESATVVELTEPTSLDTTVSLSEKEEIPEYLTDIRMAEHFIKLNNHRLRYWHDSGKWMDYDKKKWRINFIIYLIL